MQLSRHEALQADLSNANLQSVTLLLWNQNERSLYKGRSNLLLYPNNSFKLTRWVLGRL